LGKPEKERKGSIIFDIETCGYEMTELSESQQEYLLRSAEKEKDESLRRELSLEAERMLSLYPFTARVVAIGYFNVEEEKGLVYYESGITEEWLSEEKTIRYKSASEREMLEDFWKIINARQKVITFNGRGFDIPFILLRSAMLGITPSRNLMTNRYDTKTHIDLLEQLSFYGAFRKFNLDFYCRAFNIESPKSKGVSGMYVKTLYRAGRIKDIAAYCGDDIIATYLLYKVWETYLNFEGIRI